MTKVSRGQPFVGPAGRLLDRAIADAGLDRRAIFVTNAVKHFKFEPRGKRRMHKRPNAYEIERCRWWNDIERKLVKPVLIVALGATAAKSLTGQMVTIGQVRGEVTKLEDGNRLVITVHPSSLLRVKDARDRALQYEKFVDDLKVCASFL